MTSHLLSQSLLDLVESELRSLLTPSSDIALGHYQILQYHFGLLDADLQSASLPAGKRIRPLLCLLTNLACGGDAADAAPAAAGLELLHNFSLIHDDIEDQSTCRRHRDTAWVVFGMPLACNAGDAMNSLAHLAIHRLSERGVSPERVLDVMCMLERTCLSLTEGQYLDMAFEKRSRVLPSEYLTMIGLKTGALFVASCEIGAVLAGSNDATLSDWQAFGSAIGRAFQMQDDLLGIWGDESVTGKSAASDILSKKKTLPVLHAIADPNVGPTMRSLFNDGSIGVADLPKVMELMDECGARGIVESEIAHSVALAEGALDRVETPRNPEAITTLRELVSVVAKRSG